MSTWSLSMPLVHKVLRVYEEEDSVIVSMALDDFEDGMVMLWVTPL